MAVRMPGSGLDARHASDSCGYTRRLAMIETLMALNVVDADLYARLVA